ncbi:chemokine-like factor [Erpetoichthys calabaricus]|uniref:chemokine-like factor n=1 Tax=Erpetoichthys calabaricus TaxID=27687 RepID=UPI00109F0C99|nr:chemokine-like factor [Erpetoichthys calabaricus]
MDVDAAYPRSQRGALKIAEMAVIFVSLICFSSVPDTPYITVTCLEMLISLLIFLLYLTKLNKKITIFFWPLIDILNSTFAAVYMCILCLIAVSTYTARGTLAGGITGLIASGILATDGYLLFTKITFNQCKRPEISATNKPEIS